MDTISLLGLSLGLCAIVLGQLLDGRHVMSLVQPTAMREMYVAGLVGIANGENPRTIESRMRGYMG